MEFVLNTSQQGPGDQWQEVDSMRDVVEALDIGRVGAFKGAQLFKILTEVPDYERFFRVENVLPDSSSLRPGQIGTLILRTRYWLDVTACKAVGGDAAVVVAIYAATQDLSLAAAVALVRKCLDNFKRLTEDETEVVKVIIELAGSNAYRRSVLEQDILDAYVDATVSINTLLDSLTDKGVIKNRRDGRVQLQP